MVQNPFQKCSLVTDDEEDEEDVYISGKREKRPAWAKASKNTVEVTIYTHLFRTYA